MGGERAVSAYLCGGWGSSSGPRDWGTATCTSVGEELLPDSGYGLDGEVPKDKKGGLFHLGPLVADLILFIKEST